MSPADQFYWAVHARSRDDADIVAIDHRGITIIVTTALLMAERITRCHNMRLARRDDITAAQFPEIWDVVHFITGPRPGPR